MSDCFCNFCEIYRKKSSVFLNFRVRHFSKIEMNLEIYGLLVTGVMENSCSDKICKILLEHTCDGVQAAFKLILIHGAPRVRICIWSFSGLYLRAFRLRI